MTTNLQPPVGTVIETRGDAIRVFLSPEYLAFFESADWRQLKDKNSHSISLFGLVEGYALPYTVTGVLDGFTEDPNFSMHPRVETSEGIDDLEAISDESLKYYVWVEGMQLPSVSHNTRQDAVTEALRLSQKEKKMTIVCTDIIKPVTRAEVVELEE